MKITFILPRYDRKPVGGFKLVYEYANQLVARGHEVRVVHPFLLANLSTHPLGKLRLRLKGKAAQLRYSISRPEEHWHPMDSRVEMLYVPEPTASHVPDGDAVVAGFYATLEYAMKYPQEKGKKFYLLTAYETWAGSRTRVHATWQAPLEKIVISQWLYEQGLKLGVPADEMTHIPCGINHAKYRIIHPIENRPPRIAMLYHPLPLKGAEDGIRALELARGEFNALQAVLFGVFPRPSGLPSWIEYHCNPPQEELIGSIYNGSSIYLCPSWAEGFGFPPAEAMACGCALSLTDSGGVRDFAENEVTALLSPPKDPEALAENILRLLEDDELRISLAKTGHERIQEFTWERSTNLLEQLMMDSSRKTGPRC